MKEILIEIDRLAEEELKRANKIHPMFHSDHEGWAVLQEEIEEVTDFMQSVHINSKNLWDAVKNDSEDISCEMAHHIRHLAEYAAAELIQVVAMCDKFVKSQEERK